MIRKLLFVIGAAALLPAGTVSPAVAGGGCHTGATDGSGDTVEIADACFTPTILRIAPGDAVTFVNTDPFVHNVTANGWGHFDDLQPGDRFRASFDTAGTYPYACTYHPGMSGAIVVGDGAGAGAGTVTVASVAPVSPEPTLRADAAGASVGSSSNRDIGPLLSGLSIGVALGIAGGLSLARRRAAVTR
jgi:plastocyanin